MLDSIGSPGRRSTRSFTRLQLRRECCAVARNNPTLVLCTCAKLNPVQNSKRKPGWLPSCLVLLSTHHVREAQAAANRKYNVKSQICHRSRICNQCATHKSLQCNGFLILDFNNVFQYKTNRFRTPLENQCHFVTSATQSFNCISLS